MYKLTPVQKQAVDFLLANPKCVLSLYAGAGKTLATLYTLDLLQQLDMIDEIYLVSTANIINTGVWKQEMKKWDIDLDIKAVSFNLVTSMADTLIGKDFDDGVIRALIIDESSNIKNASSKSYKILSMINKYFYYKYLLTASFFSNNYLSIYSQIKYLDGGKRLGKTKSYFNARYRTPRVVKRVYEDPYRDNLHKAKLLAADIKDIVMRREKVEESLPPLNSIIHNYKASDAVNKCLEYHSESELITKRQIVSGFKYIREEDIFQPDSEDKEVEIICNLRFDKLLEVVRGIEGNIIILTNFIYEQDKISCMLKCPSYSTLNTTKRKELIIDWNEGKLKYFVAHPRSMAHGISLQFGGNNIIWFSCTDSEELAEQAEARIHRRGSPFKEVNIHHIMSDCALDETYRCLVAKKLNIAKTIYNNL